MIFFAAGKHFAVLNAWFDMVMVCHDTSRSLTCLEGDMYCMMNMNILAPFSVVAAAVAAALEVVVQQHMSVMKIQ